MAFEIKDLKLDDEIRNPYDLGNPGSNHNSAPFNLNKSEASPVLTPKTATKTYGAYENSPSAQGSGKLTVGKEISLNGEIKSCDHLDVQGNVEATLSDCRFLEVSATGVFKGSAKVEDADISGSFEGDLQVNGSLILRSTGRIVGNVRYNKLEIEYGGKVAGYLEVADQNFPKTSKAKTAETASTLA